jgi:hypothetical protein
MRVGRSAWKRRCRLRATIGSVVLALGATLALVTPAVATPIASDSAPTVRPDTPSGRCGDSFRVTYNAISGEMKVVGYGLSAFSPHYMLVFATYDGRGYGPYNASPHGGARFVFDTPYSLGSAVYIQVTDDDNTTTLCHDAYYPGGGQPL